MTELERTAVMPPDRIAQHLKQDKHGRYVPWFVAWVNGEPDFRIVDPDRTREAVRFSKCFICGQPIGRWLTFPVGPMCTVNRTTPEPPSHKECATYSARVCPFLTRPAMRRREAGMPEETTLPPGQMIRRNPGVVAIYTTRSYKPWRAPDGGVLFTMGDPEEVTWLAEGRLATRTEVLASLDSGCPALRDMAEAEGAEAVAELELCLRRAREWLPEEASP